MIHSTDSSTQHLRIAFLCFAVWLPVVVSQNCLGLGCLDCITTDGCALCAGSYTCGPLSGLCLLKSCSVGPCNTAPCNFGRCEPINSTNYRCVCSKPYDDGGNCTRKTHNFISPCGFCPLGTQCFHDATGKLSCVPTATMLQRQKDDCYIKTCSAGFFADTELAHKHCGNCSHTCGPSEECWLGACNDNSFGLAILAGLPILLIGISVAILRLCIGSWRRDLRSEAWPLRLNTTKLWFLKRPQKNDMLSGTGEGGVLPARFNKFGVKWTWFDTPKRQHDYFSIFYRTWEDDIPPSTKFAIYFPIMVLHFLSSALLYGIYQRLIYNMCGDVSNVANFGEYLVPFVAGFLTNVFAFFDGVRLCQYYVAKYKGKTIQYKLSVLYLVCLTLGGLLFWICMCSLGFNVYNVRIGGDISGRHMFRMAVLTILLSWGTDILIIVVGYFVRKFLFGIRKKEIEVVEKTEAEKNAENIDIRYNDEGMPDYYLAFLEQAQPYYAQSRLGGPTPAPTPNSPPRGPMSVGRRGLRSPIMSPSRFPTTGGFPNASAPPAAAAPRPGSPPLKPTS